MDKKYKEIIDKLNNKTIGYVSYQPDGSPFVTVGRKIRVNRPPQLVEMLKKLNGEEIKELVPCLIEALDNLDKDFAADVILYTLTGEDAAIRQYFYDVEKWQKQIKKREYPYWKKWWQENKDRLVWNGSFLKIRNSNREEKE